MKSKIVHKEEPKSSIPSEISSAEILIETVASENVEKARIDHENESKHRTVSLPFIKNEEEEKSSLSSLPKKE